VTDKAVWAGAPGNLYCGRSTPELGGELGNPFSIREYGRERAIELYQKLALPNITLEQKQKVKAASFVGCYCEPGLACHTDSLIEAAFA
jgi:hypothetical protein